LLYFVARFSRLRFQKVASVFLSGSLFVAAWALLNVTFNLRFPAWLPEPSGWFLLPSLDVTVLLAMMALLAAFGRELNLGVLASLAGVALAVRLYRLSDGLILNTYYRPLNLAIDVPLLPELFRLLYSTLSLPKFILVVVGALVALTVLLTLLTASLFHAQHFLAARMAHRVFFVLVALLPLELGWLWPADQHPTLHKGLFGASIVPELEQQVRLAFAGSKMEMVKATEIAAVQRRLRNMPSGLEHLHKADVLFFLIESYGAVAFRNHDFLQRLRPAFDSLATVVGSSGYAVASAAMNSPTYGGRSWLAHATLASGARIGDEREYSVLLRQQRTSLTLASFFQRSGYRTVLVQPGTTRRFPEGMVQGFTQQYFRPDLDYHGPAHGWATMPDQYTVDFVHRREVDRPRAPLFIQYALVSSHAHWAVQPPLVEDWSTLEQGRIFHQLAPRTYPVEWTTMYRGGDAYVESILYDLEVLKRYIVQRLERPTLIIVMGDHQPPVLATDDSSWAIPVHVLSKDPALIERFVQVGFIPGMFPQTDGALEGMETFVTMLVERLSASAD